MSSNASRFAVALLAFALLAVLFPSATVGRQAAGSDADDCWTSDQEDFDSDGAMAWSDPPAMTIDPANSYVATIETNAGAIEIELLPVEAPATVNNFVCLARSGYYDGTPVHRIVQGFVIQAGDPTGTGTGGPGYEFDDEPISQELDYVKGAVAMANAGPDTNGSQFFICSDDLSGRLPKNYTIFGQVISGMDIVDELDGVSTAVRNGEKSSPIDPVIVEEVTIAESSESGNAGGEDDPVSIFETRAAEYATFETGD